MDLVQLTELDVSKNTLISDVVPLVKLKKLKLLKLSKTHVKDVMALSQLADLEELHLNGTFVDDILAVARLKKLKKVVVRKFFPKKKIDDFKKLNANVEVVVGTELITSAAPRRTSPVRRRRPPRRPSQGDRRPAAGWLRARRRAPGGATNSSRSASGTTRTPSSRRASGSMNVSPRLMAKCRCGPVTRPVCPDVPDELPRLDVLPCVDARRRSATGGSRRS